MAYPILNNREIKAVFFDLDGTFLDTAPTFAKVLNKLLANHKKPALDERLIRNTVSDGARALITLAFGLTEGQAGFEEKKEELLLSYEENLSDGSHSFEGIDSLLQTLKKQGIIWGIITNKPSRYTLPLLKKLNYCNECAVVICPDDVKETKPNPEPMLLACQRSNTQPENSIYLGDHTRDIEAGKAANMLTVACGYGYIKDNDSIEQWNADYDINHVNEFKALLFK